VNVGQGNRQATGEEEILFAGSGDAEILVPDPLDRSPSMWGIVAEAILPD